MRGVIPGRAEGANPNVASYGEQSLRYCEFGSTASRRPGMTADNT